MADGAASGRELLRILLEHEGYEVFEASDGREAVEKARALLPDLVLLDLDLPVGDGYAAARELRLDERLENCCIVALTAGAGGRDSERVVNAGFNGSIAKPVVPRVLREQLARRSPMFPGDGKA